MQSHWSSGFGWLELQKAVWAECRPPVGMSAGSPANRLLAGTTHRRRLPSRRRVQAEYSLHCCWRGTRRWGSTSAPLHRSRSADPAAPCIYCIPATAGLLVVSCWRRRMPACGSIEINVEQMCTRAAHQAAWKRLDRWKQCFSLPASAHCTRPFRLTRRGRSGWLRCTAQRCTARPALRIRAGQPAPAPRLAPCKCPTEGSPAHWCR